MMDKKTIVLVSVFSIVVAVFVIVTIVLALKLKKSGSVCPQYPTNDRMLNVNSNYKIPTYIIWLSGTPGQNSDVIQNTLSIIRSKYPMADLATENDLNLVSQYLALPQYMSNTNFDEYGYIYGNDITYSLSVGMPTNTGTASSYKPTLYPDNTMYSMWVRIPTMDTFSEIQNNLTPIGINFLLSYANMLLN